MVTCQDAEGSCTMFYTALSNTKLEAVQAGITDTDMTVFTI